MFYYTVLGAQANILVCYALVHLRVQSLQLSFIMVISTVWTISSLGGSMKAEVFRETV